MQAKEFIKDLLLCAGIIVIIPPEPIAALGFQERCMCRIVVILRFGRGRFEGAKRIGGIGEHFPCTVFFGMTDPDLEISRYPRACNHMRKRTNMFVSNLCYCLREYHWLDLFGVNKRGIKFMQE